MPFEELALTEQIMQEAIDKVAGWSSDTLNSGYSTTGPRTLTWHPIDWWSPNTNPTPYTSPYDYTITRAIVPEQQNEKELKGYIMKKLFNVYVIDDIGQFLMNRAVIADDEADAKFEAKVDEVIRKHNLKYKDVTVVTQLISGGIKIKEQSEDVQLVKVVE